MTETRAVGQPACCCFPGSQLMPPLLPLCLPARPTPSRLAPLLSLPSFSASFSWHYSRFLPLPLSQVCCDLPPLYKSHSHHVAVAIQ